MQKYFEAYYDKYGNSGGTIGQRTSLMDIDIDKAVIYTSQKDPLNYPWMIWGYKGEGE